MTKRIRRCWILLMRAVAAWRVGDREAGWALVESALGSFDRKRG